MSSTLATKAQHWGNTGIPPGSIDTWMSYADTVHDALYFGGLGANVTDSSVVAYYPVYRYQNGQWNTPGVFGNAINTAVVYHDTLIVGGAFHTVNGEAMHGIICYVNGTWQPYGNLGPPPSSAVVYELRVLDGDLYAVGVFAHADGHLCNSIAKRVGGHWENVGDLSGLTTAPTLVDIAKYNGNLVVTGNNIHNTGEPLLSVMQYDGTSWGPMGAGDIGWCGDRPLAAPIRRSAARSGSRKWPDMPPPSPCHPWPDPGGGPYISQQQCLDIEGL